MRYYEDVTYDTRESKEFEITKKAIIEFAKAWDPQPFHVDEEAAKQFPMGLIASSAHLFSISLKLGGSPEIQDGLVLVAGLGWDNMRIPNPAKAGDRLRARTSIESKHESKSKPDMGIIVSKFELLNQHDDVVLSYQNSVLVMKRPSDE